MQRAFLLHATDTIDETLFVNITANIEHLQQTICSVKYLNLDYDRLPCLTIVLYNLLNTGTGILF